MTAHGQDGEYGKAQCSHKVQRACKRRTALAWSAVGSVGRSPVAPEDMCGLEATGVSSARRHGKAAESAASRGGSPDAVARPPDRFSVEIRCEMVHIAEP